MLTDTGAEGGIGEAKLNSGLIFAFNFIQTSWSDLDMRDGNLESKKNETENTWLPNIIEFHRQ